MGSSPDEHTRWLAALQEPLALAGTTLPNRLMMSALTLQYGSDGLLSNRHTAFYRARARGGVGLLFSEQLNASPLSVSPFAHALSAHDSRQIAAFQHLARVLEPFPTRFFAQLFSAGAAGNSTVGVSAWAPLRGPSNVPAPGGDLPVPLSEEEIAQLVSDYAVSAQNVREGQLHGVALHGAHGWLIGQFLSPFYNKRTDRYGGSVENRCRLALEIGRAVRAAVGPDFPFGISLTYDELMGPDGITEADTLEQLRVMGRERIFDFFDLSLGSSHQQHYTIGSMAVPEGITLAFAARAKSAVAPEAAIFTSGRITDVYQAGRAIATKQTDVVGMARALLADPQLLVKATASSGRTITRCVGANYCVARALVDQPVSCVLTPSTGRETQWPLIARAVSPLRIVVVGAGPAGLKFASVAATAGHDVVVFERKSQPGGHLSLLAKLPTRQAWRHAIEDMTGTLQSCGGRLYLDTEATAEMTLESAPDLVVVATGAYWEITDIGDQHAQAPQCPQFLPLDVAIEAATDVGARSVFGEHTLIVDATGTYAPLGLADALTGLGIAVTIVTRNESLGLVASLELDLQHVMPRLSQRGVRSIVAHRISGASAKEIVLESIWGPLRQTIEAVDCLVFAEARLPNNQLYSQLQDRHPRVHCIGDALSPRSTAAILHEGESLARMLSTEHRR